MRMLQNDPVGTAAWIEREAAGMDPNQLYREFVQNGTEAGATKVIIDGWRCPDTGRLLARITDNGCGMTDAQLLKRLSTIHGQFKGANNFGVGARIASLPSNPAGLTFASRTAESEGMVTLVKEKHTYGIKNWRVEDTDGNDVSAEVVAPDAGMMDRLDDTETGTVVVLHGDGKHDTWNTSTSYQVHKFLARRYYDFGGDVTVQVEKFVGGGKSLIPVTSMGGYFADYAEADGEVPFTGISGLSGVMFWWIIPSQREAPQEYRISVPGGVGLVVDNEVFDYARTYMAEFGVPYKSVQNRVSVLVFIDGATMGTGRADVILPGGNLRNTPWKKLGAHFAQNLPEEIASLNQQVMPSSNPLDVELAKLLDAEWFKNLDPILVKKPADEADETGSGDDEGSNLPDEGADIPESESEKNPNPNPRPRKPANQSNAGNSPVKDIMTHVPPKVEFDSDFDWDTNPFGLVFVSNMNTVYVATDCPPYVREVQRWKEKTSHSDALITAAVEYAYTLELGATIIDAGKMARDPRMSASQVDDLRAPAVLFGKLMGMQAITASIEKKLQELVRSA